MKGFGHVFGEGLCSNVYYYESGEEILFIDSGNGEIDLQEIAQEREITVILTHAHLDHTGGCLHLKDAHIFLHPKEFDYKDNFIFKIPKNGKRMDFHEFEFGERKFQIIHTPGHTMGSICVYEPQEKVLFSGDTLFAHGDVGRTDLGGDDELLRKSLTKIKRMDYKLLAPGHMEMERKRKGLI